MTVWPQYHMYILPLFLGDHNFITHLTGSYKSYQSLALSISPLTYSKSRTVLATWLKLSNESSTPRLTLRSIAFYHIAVFFNVLKNSGLNWFGLVLWHINHCRLFNAKSIFIHINSSISKNSVLHKYTVEMSKTFLFQAIQFSQ